MHGRRFFISENDFEQFKGETALPVQVYAFTSSDGERVVSAFKEYSDYDLGMSKNDIKESYMMQDIMAYMLVLTSAFLILIILLTIRFTIKVSLIEDEKEIGMMRNVIKLRDELRFLYQKWYRGLFL